MKTSKGIIVMYKSIFFFLLSILFLVSSAYSQKVEFSGWGITGINIYDRNNLNDYSQEMYYAGKLQASIEYNDNIDAQLDFRGNSVDNSVELREFSVKFKFAEKLRWKVGNIKKPFGYEQSIKREQLISVDRSNIYNRISQIGYGGRSVSIMAYYEYSKKREDYPYSYFLSVFKDNSLTTGAVARGIYHSDKYSYGLSYLFQNLGGVNSISAHGFAADFLVEKKDYSTSIEVFLVQDPIEGKVRKGNNSINNTSLNESVFTTGVKALTSIEYKTDAEVITKIEPFLLTSYLIPDLDNTKNHVIQTALGANLYFTKKIRTRFEGNLILTKNQFNKDYVTDESMITFELQVRF
jgi:hypothetical protein